MSDDHDKLRQNPVGMRLARLLHAATFPDTSLEADVENENFLPDPLYVVQALALIENYYLADQLFSALDTAHKIRAIRAEREQRNQEMGDAIAFAFGRPATANDLPKKIVQEIPKDSQLHHVLDISRRNLKKGTDK